MIFWPAFYVYDLARNDGGLYRSLMAYRRPEGAPADLQRQFTREVIITLAVHVAVMTTGLLIGLFSKYSVATVPATLSSFAVMLLVGMVGSIAAKLPVDIGLPFIVLLTKVAQQSEQGTVQPIAYTYRYEAFPMCDLAFWCGIALLVKLAMAALGV